MGKSAPKPTPPKETSAAQTGSSVSTAIANAFLQNMNETTPDGTKTFDQTGSYTFTDPYTNQTYTVPRFAVTQTLSAPQQAIKDQQDATSLNLSKLANQQSGFLGDYMAKPFQYDPGKHENWSLGLYDKLNADKNAQDEDAMRAQLANQGIKVGSEAYDRAMGNLYEARGTNRDRFLLDSFKTGFSTAQAERNQPINEITALMSGGQVSQPQFMTGAGAGAIPTTDNASIIANNDAQRMAAWQQSQAATGSMIGGLGGLFALSDERAKTDEKKIGETEDGIGLYSFRYNGQPDTQIGLIAQDVKRKKPQAVRKRPDGLFEVDYRRALS